MIKLPKLPKMFNLFVEGVGYAGRVESVKPPDLSIKTETIQGGGMDAPMSYDLGLEELEAKFVWMETTPEMVKMFGVFNGHETKYRLEAALNDDSEQVVNQTIWLRGMPSKMEWGDYKRGEKTSVTITVKCKYYKHAIDGQELTHIDVVESIRKVGGVDQLEKYRTAIGL